LNPAGVTKEVFLNDIKPCKIYDFQGFMVFRG